MSTDSSIFNRPPRPQRRVVVTGMGTLTPLGNDVQTSWDRAIKGESGIGPITQFDASSFDSRIAGEVRDFDIDKFIAKKEQKKMDRFIHFAMACSKMALDDSGLEISESLAPKVGTFIGVGIGGLPMIERQKLICETRGPSRLTPFFIPAVITNLAAGQVSIAHGLKGPSFSVTSACATGAHAIGEAARYIRDGLCTAMVAGGVEATICPLAIGGFAAMKALSTRNDEPQKASRPWDTDRDGFVIAEGGGILVLEDYESASSRGAHIYAEVTGYGASSDAFHMASPTPDGNGAQRAMKMAIADAGINTSDIDYVNAHGTSTPAGDQIECLAIKATFGLDASKLWVSSTKSMIGHTLGGAGAIESVFAIKALETGIVPPTINLDQPGEGCNLDFVPITAREKKLNHVLNNSFGFGGTNASLLFSRI